MFTLRILGPSMQIEFERSGGFTGIPLKRSISAKDLTSEEQARLQELIQSAGFFDLPAVIRSTSPGADRFQYNISIESNERNHSVQIDEAAVPTQLRPLIAWLQNAPKR